jgi:hypothetical protein
MNYVGFEHRLPDTEHMTNSAVHIRTIPTLCDKSQTIIHSFDHLFSVDLLQDMEIVMSIIVQEKTAAYSIYM